jgi:large subunit ribosomal protein L7/L12
MAKIQKLESLEKLKQRKQDTRRKILIGAYFLDKANQADYVDKLYQEIESYIARPMDKELFKMPELIDNQVCLRRPWPSWSPLIFLPLRGSKSTLPND